MKITSKNCPNCGALLEFNIGDEKTICNYCQSQINIDWENKKSINSKDIIHMNKNWEIFKNVFAFIHFPIIILLGIILLFCSEKIYGLILIISGILSIPYISNLIFRKLHIVKIIVIEIMIIIGLIGGLINIYPITIKDKFYSDTTNMIVEVKGNYIIINEDGKITKERYQFRELLHLYGVNVYELKTSKYTFKYKHYDKDATNIKDELYIINEYDETLDTFHTKKQLEKLNIYSTINQVRRLA